MKVGETIVVKGRKFWITKISGVSVEVMPDPDDAKGKARSNFWPTFWVIVLIIAILKMI